MYSIRIAPTQIYWTTLQHLEGTIQFQICVEEVLFSVYYPCMWLIVVSNPSIWDKLSDY